MAGSLCVSTSFPPESFSGSGVGGVQAWQPGVWELSGEEAGGFRLSCNPLSSAGP